MNCPLCIDQVLQPNHRAGIEIDVCPNCKGVWLDRGEIDKLAADHKTASRPVVSAPASSPPPDRARDRRDDSWERPKKGKKSKRKKSLAERLGDALEDALDL